MGGKHPPPNRDRVNNKLNLEGKTGLFQAVTLGPQVVLKKYLRKVKKFQFFYPSSFEAI